MNLGLAVVLIVLAVVGALLIPTDTNKAAGRSVKGEPTWVGWAIAALALAAAVWWAVRRS